jgi:glycosyltransferase involved in cell wall biosynthesis
MTCTVWHVYREALRQKADVYHFHDPELIGAGALLKLTTNSMVVFDVHENYPLVALRRSWIPRLLHPLAQLSVWLSLRLFLPFFDAVVCATESIEASFPHKCKITLKNFADLDVSSAEDAHANNMLVYAGVIFEERGIAQFLEAYLLMNRIMPVRLRLVGVRSRDIFLERQLRRCPLDMIEVLPWMKHEEALQWISEGTLGLGLDLPLPGSDGPPTKFFEYMALGLPIVSADLPLMRKIVEEAGCGIVVDFRNPQEVADKIVDLLRDPGRIEMMRQRGLQAFIKHYHWRTQVPKLLALYEGLGM